MSNIVFFQQKEEAAVKPRILIAVNNEQVQSWFCSKLEDQASITIYKKPNDLDNQDGIIILRYSTVGGIENPPELADRFLSFNPDGSILFVAGILDQEGKEQIRSMKSNTSQVYVASADDDGVLGEELVNEKIEALLNSIQDSKKGSSKQENNHKAVQKLDPPKKQSVVQQEEDEQLMIPAVATHQQNAVIDEEEVKAIDKREEVEETTKNKEKQREQEVKKPEDSAKKQRNDRKRKTKEHECKIITVVSPKGGVGKTTTSANLAVLLQTEFGMNTALLELTKQTGSILSHFQLNPDVTVKNWIGLTEYPETIEEVEEKLMQCNITDLWLLPGQSLLDEDECNTILSVEDVNSIIGSLSPHFDVIVVDGGCIPDDIFYQLLDISAHVLLVSNIEQATLQDCHYLAAALLEKHNIDTSKVIHVLNKYKKNLGMNEKEAAAFVGLDSYHVISHSPKVEKINKEAREPYLARKRKKADGYENEMVALASKLVDNTGDTEKKGVFMKLLKKVIGQ